MTVQPQLLPQPPSHVLDMEAVFSPPQQQQPPPQQQQQGPGDNNNTGAGGQDGDSGWSAILNSNPELKAVVSACEK